tara:strand:- start:28 stop:396 length:369 start_codon:yes stop_codon:yes gene_type:complete
VRVRYGDISNVGLYNTNERQCLLAARPDEVEELAIGFFHEAQIAWTGAFGTSIGISGATMILESIADLPVIRDLWTTFSYAPKFNATYSFNESTDKSSEEKKRQNSSHRIKKAGRLEELYFR